jgi:plastocyanin
VKRIITVLAVLSLVVSAGCSSKKTGIGEGLEGVGSSTIASPTPSKTKTPSKAPTTKAPPKTVAPNPGYKGITVPFTISSSAEGYNPRDKVIRVGDTLTFENLDPNQKHTFTEDKGAWDSGELAKGDKPYSFKVNLAPGDYTFHCELVPYVLGGPIRVLAAPK